MPQTPLQEIEAVVHDQFENPPTNEQAAEVIQKQFPKMDGGLSIAIALAALVLQGWQIYREETRQRARGTGGGSRCPQCGHTEVSKDSAGRSVCDQGHTW